MAVSRVSYSIRSRTTSGFLITSLCNIWKKSHDNDDVNIKQFYSRKSASIVKEFLDVLRMCSSEGQFIIKTLLDMCDRTITSNLVILIRQVYLKVIWKPILEISELEQFSSQSDAWLFDLFWWYWKISLRGRHLLDHFYIACKSLCSGFILLFYQWLTRGKVKRCTT